jgi:membrane protein
VNLPWTYGSAASVILVLLWLYYSAYLFLLGAEFTYVYARELGSQRRNGHR